MALFKELINGICRIFAVLFLWENLARKKYELIYWDVVLKRMLSDSLSHLKGNKNSIKIVLNNIFWKKLYQEFFFPCLLLKFFFQIFFFWLSSNFFSLKNCFEKGYARLSRKSRLSKIQFNLQFKNFLNSNKKWNFSFQRNSLNRKKNTRNSWETTFLLLSNFLKSGIRFLEHRVST